MKPQYKVRSVAHLKKILSDGNCYDFIMLLAGGALRSSKTLSYDGKLFYIFHSIDGSEEELKSLKDTNILKAIKKGAFYYEGQVFRKHKL